MNWAKAHPKQAQWDFMRTSFQTSVILRDFNLGSIAIIQLDFGSDQNCSNCETSFESQLSVLVKSDRL